MKPQTILHPALLPVMTLISTSSLLASLDPVVPADAAKGSIPAHFTSQSLPGWGRLVNPDGDCRAYLHPQSLLLHVPGGTRAHDLAPDIKLVNAPRVLQAVQGDFTLQVRVDGRFSPGIESTAGGRTAYNGAGLVAVLDDHNVVTLARAVLQRPGGKPEPYANFEIRINGKLERFGQTSDHALPLNKPVHLRLERRGRQFLAAASLNGSDWHTLAPKQQPNEWSKNLQVGVIAISTSKEEFNPRFDRLQLLK